MSLRLLSKLLRFRTLWAYGFDRAARRAPKKLKAGEVKVCFFLIPLIERQKFLIHQYF